MTCRVTNELAFNQVYRGPQKPVPCLVSRLRAFKKKVDLRKKNGPHFLICFKRGSFFYFRAAAEKSTFSTDETERLGLLPSRQNYTLLDLVNFVLFCQTKLNCMPRTADKRCCWFFTGFLTLTFPYWQFFVHPSDNKSYQFFNHHTFSFLLKLWRNINPDFLCFSWNT